MTVTSFSRPIASVLVGLALLMLSACAPQTPNVPPVADVEFPAPTKDIWQASADGDIAELEANKRAGTDLDGLMQGAAKVTSLTVAVVTGQSSSVKWLLVFRQA